MQLSLIGNQSVATRKELRDYQEDCIEALFDYFSEKSGEPIAVIPVGGGKSLIMAEFMYRANQYFNPTRFMIISHVSILLTQNAEELFNQWPSAKVSFYSDSLNSKDLSGDIIFAGIQSIYKKAFDLRHAPDLIIIDECHTISPEDSTMYRKFLSDMRVINPQIRIIGFTATPFRTGYGYLHKGKNALFTDIAYEISILELIQRGHLCPAQTPQITTKMDVRGVGTRGGDYITSQLSRAVDDAKITKACVDEMMQHGEGRAKWLVFCVDIQHAEHVQAEIASRGISCAMMHSKMSAMDNNAAMDKFKNGNLRCLVNVAMLTTGVNVPAIDMIAFCRPTRSPVLYIQCVGRGLRTSKGKADCLLLDFGGVVEELGPIDQVRVKEKGDGEGEAPVKYCPGILPSGNHCNATLHAATMKCPHCGYEFPEPGLNLDGTPSNAAVLSPQLKAQVFPVSAIKYYRHKKEGKPDTVRVEYLCGFETYREWVHPEHMGIPRERACSWWRSRAATKPPNTVTEALSRVSELKEPTHVHVKKIGKYREVVAVEFKGDMANE